jgi:hypothetical protein
MFFTQEDYRKIEKWLLANSRKDTDFVGAATPLKGNETVVLVQNGKNVNVLLKDLIEQIFLLGVSDFLNVTDKYNESYISLTQAIQLIPFKSRKTGQVITFLDENGKWRIYQFQGARLNQWNNTTLWIDLIKQIQGISIIDSEDIIVDINNDNQASLYLADKNYNTADYSGLGRVYLRKNIQRVQNPDTGVPYNTNLLTQQMISKENTIYIIQYDYNLNGQTITIPDNCILQFEGGSISTGTLKLINTSVFIPNYNIENYIKSSIIGEYRIGQVLYNKITNQYEYYNGTEFLASDGFPASIIRKGSSAERPVLDNRYYGFKYLDTTLDSNIYWRESGWINMDGTLVDKVIII